ncbi:protein of unknown function [Pseudomonas mediterranea]
MPNNTTKTNAMVLTCRAKNTKISPNEISSLEGFITVISYYSQKAVTVSNKTSAKKIKGSQRELNL